MGELRKCIESAAMDWCKPPRRLLLRGTDLAVVLESGSRQALAGDAKGPLSSLTIIIEEGDGAF